MKKWLGQLELSLSLVGFGFLLVKGSFSTVGWSEALGITLVLVVHYAKSLVPERTTKTLEVAQVQAALQDLEHMKEDVNTLKLAAGLKLPGPKPPR